MALVIPGSLVAVALIAAGCGSSSKPAYCSNVSELKKSVEELKSVQLTSGVLSTLQADVSKVHSNAEAAVSSAKQDFPSQTSALNSSVSSLSTAVKKLPANPTPPQLLALTAEIAAVVNAGKELSSATSSACE